MAEPDILCACMTVVDVLASGLEAMPRMGDTGMVSGITLAIGGDATNQAVALSKLGNRAGLMALVGDDAQGKFILEQCKLRGVNTAGICVDPGVSTTTSIVLIDNTGEHVFLGARAGSAVAMEPKHYDLDLIKPSLKIFAIGSLFWAPGFDRYIATPLLKKAKSVGAITLADMSMDYIAGGFETLGEGWAYIDYAAPSELEAELLTGSKDPATIAHEFRKRGVKDVILKRGLNGIMAFIGDQVHECPAFEVPTVDTTGAGDTFMAGFMHCLVRNVPPEKAIQFASACAALSIQEVGAGAGLKNLQQVEDFMKARRLS
jgi:sugar/nucleoside kinase (ribokinase family)